MEWLSKVISASMTRRTHLVVWHTGDSKYSKARGTAPHDNSMTCRAKGMDGDRLASDSMDIVRARDKFFVIRFGFREIT